MPVQLLQHGLAEGLLETRRALRDGGGVLEPGDHAHFFPTELAGLCAFLGGAAAKAVLKAAGKYTPVDQ